MEVDSKGKERFHLTREGGHSHRRILHAADATGKAVQTTLISQVQQHPKITLLEQYNAIDLVKDKARQRPTLKACMFITAKRIALKALPLNLSHWPRRCQ